MQKIVSLVALLAALALQPVLAPAQVIDRIAATVNDDIITTVDVDKEYAQLLKDMDRLPAAEKMGLTKTDALNRLIDKKLVDQKVRELDIRVSDEEVKAAIDDVKKQNNIKTQQDLEKALAGQGLTYEQYRSQLKEQIERARLMGQEVRAKIQVGEREVREYYDKNSGKYGGEDQFHARQIFFKIKKHPDAEEMAKVEAKAREVVKEARSGKDFGELAKKYSDDPNAGRDGGDLGTFKKSDMLPEIADAVSAMKPGDISDPVLSPAGMHIIKLEERSKIPGKPFEEVKGDIEDLLYKKKADERFAQWVKDLRAAAAIEIKK
jgi:peptidyl-prolyl cis-trans isomerase SurA